MNRKVEDRDDKGRFLTGNNGGGRPVGSRNRLAVEFVDGLASEFAARGQQAIKQVCKNDPVAFLKIVSSVLPREVLLKATLNVTATDEYEDLCAVHRGLAAGTSAHWDIGRPSDDNHQRGSGRHIR